MRPSHCSRILFITFCLSTVTASAQPSPARPTVWMGPPSFADGKCFRELFEKPDEWRQTRSVIDGVMVADHMLHKQFTDAELQAWLPMLDQWKLKFALEVGAVKPWGATGEKAFHAQRPMWDRFQRLGGRIHTIAMDEPLCCARKDLHQPDAYAVEETAKFIALVRKHYPQIRIGSIEPYPFVSLADLQTWIESLQRRLAAMQVRGLDFFRLDVNWVEFSAQSRGSWKEVRKLEQFCRQRKLPFSMIYWASGYPALEHRGLADDSTWYVSTMQQAYDYAIVDGAPDELVIQSWLEAPSRCVPETDAFTFTRSVLDFSRKFAKRAPSRP
jgi:hypothetical protein